MDREKSKNLGTDKKEQVLAIYLRLSKEDGDQEESNSIQNQRNLLLQFIQKQPEFYGCRVLEFSDRKIVNLIQIV